MSGVALMTGAEVLLVGVEWDTFDGEPGVRAYFGHRTNETYVQVTDPAARRELTRWWNPNLPYGGPGGGHLTIPAPSRDQVFVGPTP